MLGVFGKSWKVGELKLNPDIIYINADKIHRFEDNVVPVIWVPKAIDPDEYVVDIYGDKHLFAFDNSGCIANPKIIERTIKIINKIAELGYNEVLLDALRLPSPFDKNLFLTTCFCKYSLKIYPKLGELRDLIKNVMEDTDAKSLRNIFMELVKARAYHVKNILSILSKKAVQLGLKLSAAVFPYPLSRYVGQEPRIMKNYLNEIHVMLYHKCFGAACLNAEYKNLFELLKTLKLDYNGLKEIFQHVTGFRIGSDATKYFTEGLGIKYIEEALEANRRIYGDKFIPILWLDDRLESNLQKFLDKYEKLDLFIP